MRNQVNRRLSPKALQIWMGDVSRFDESLALPQSQRSYLLQKRRFPSRLAEAKDGKLVTLPKLEELAGKPIAPVCSAK